MARSGTCRFPLFLALVLGAGGAEAAGLRLCAANWPPFTTVAEGSREAAGEHAGKVVRILGELGYQAQIDVVSWQRCLKDMADGHYAGAYAAPHRREWEAIAVYPRLPLGTLRFVAVVRRGEGGAWKPGSSPALLPQPVGLPWGWAPADALRRDHHLTLDDASMSNDQDIRKLLAGRLGSTVVEVRTARVLLARFDPGRRLEVLDPPVADGQKVYVLFSRRALGKETAQALAEGFSARLAAAGGR